MPAGLRERKKQRTKAAIGNAALQLFLERGFEETTVAEIAAAADVSPRTFFSYYATKEEAAFSGREEDLSEMRERIAGRAPGESVIQAIRGWAIDLMSDPDFSDRLEVQRRKLIRETPALAAYESAHIDVRFRGIVGTAVAEDLGIEASALAPRMVAAAASAALRAMVDFYAETDAGHEPEQLLDHASRFLEAGLASFDDR